MTTNTGTSTIRNIVSTLAMLEQRDLVRAHFVQGTSWDGRGEVTGHRLIHGRHGSSSRARRAGGQSRLTDR